jgi:hypothetical protein
MPGSSMVDIVTINCQNLFKQAQSQKGMTRRYQEWGNMQGD